MRVFAVIGELRAGAISERGVFFVLTGCRASVDTDKVGLATVCVSGVVLAMAGALAGSSERSTANFTGKPGLLTAQVSLSLQTT